MAAAAAVQGLEVSLAQRLASNDKSVRNKALKTLRKYISLRSHKAEGGFTADDLLKIWKGLFYCLWMQDKPLLQGELSDKISSLIHSFHTSSSQLLFLETFLQTVKREWNGIDRLRMDKFLQLVRFIFKQAFEVLRRKEWDLSLINQFLEVISVQLLQTTGPVPNGLVLHVLELYLKELGHVGAAELTADQNLTFLSPFFKTMARTKSRWLLSSICKNIFRTIVDQAAFAIEDLMTELQEGVGDSDAEEEEESRNTKETKRGKPVNGFSEVKGSSAEEDEDEAHLENTGSKEDEMGHVLQFDYGAVADRLFALGGHSNTHNFNRTKIYNLVKIFRNLSEGVFPDEDDGSSESSDEDEFFSFLKTNRVKKKRTRETEEISQQRIKSPEEHLSTGDGTEPRRTKKKKSKRLKSMEQDANGDPDAYTETWQGPPETETPEIQTNGGSIKTKKKNKKRKSSAEPESNDASNDVTAGEPCGTKKNKKPKRDSEDRCLQDGDTSEPPSNAVKKRKGKDRNQENRVEPEIGTENQAEPKSKSKKKKRTSVLTNLPSHGGDEPTAPTSNPTGASEEAAPKRKSKKKSRASVEVLSTGSEPEVCPPPPQNGGKKKRKVQKADAEAPVSNGLTEASSGKKPEMINVPDSTPVRSNNKTKKKDKSRPSAFVSFQGVSKPPAALFCKTKRTLSTPPTAIKKCPTPKSETKKVTFGLKNNKTAEFKKTDRSLLVSPVGPSRVAFDPKKRPVSGVLKSPPGFSAVSVKKSAPKKRATAADFF